MNSRHGLLDASSSTASSGNVEGGVRAYGDYLEEEEDDDIYADDDILERETI